MVTLPSRAKGAAPSPVLLVLLAILSVQFGGAMAATLLPLIGVTGSVTLRLVLAVALLLLFARPRVRGYTRSDWITVISFGVSLAAMNTAFYASLTRLPIGVAVTIEFVGPLLLAATLSRRLRDFLAVLVAAVGVLLISEVLNSSADTVDPIGVLLALTAGAAWAAYILLSARAGQRFPRLDGLTLAMIVAAVLVAPFGVATAGAALVSPEALLKGLGIALLSSVLPYSLELLALRRLAARIFGILLSLEPAVAALAGFVVLGQLLSPVQLVGIACVVLASVAVTRTGPPPSRHEGAAEVG
ncbi:hypothetical protein KILIM_005_00310 [Kineosphaera limosa NBRC 100340]|uniref:EamA domain-containing protein n=1 Tax=Kineosphaera limosa NBRC 100340 TaxID=1184609 RepID=K6VDZ1_9MICO|nr:hypothetical protein KILIM_005_00310 [Kineosphaera limosa NBRC 100340]